MNNYDVSGEIIKWNNGTGSKITAGSVIDLGVMLGIAVNDIADGADGAVRVMGSIQVTKASGSAWTAGTTRVYYDSSAGNFTATPTAQYAGIATYDAGSSATTGYVLLNVDTERGDLSTEIADPGDTNAIPVTATGRVPLVTDGSETRTLAAPSYAGQRLQLEFKTDGGDCVITCSTGVNQTGNDTLTFADAGDHMILSAIDVGGDLRWRVVCNDGVNLTTA